MSRIHFVQGLRDSAEPIQGMCLLRQSNEFLTYDASALRVWNFQKPVKVFFHKEKNQGLKFVKILPMDRFQCAILVFTQKSDQGISTILRLVSRQLTTLQEIELKIHASSKIVLSECGNTLLIQDKNNTVDFYHVQYLEQKLEHAGTSQDISNILFLSTKPSLPKLKEDKPKPALIRLHLVDSLDTKSCSINDFVVLNTHTVLLLGKEGLLFYTRSSLLKPPPEKRKKTLFDDEILSSTRPKSKGKNRKGSEMNGTEVGNKKSTETKKDSTNTINTSIYQDYKHTSSLTLRYYETARSPLFVRVMKENIVFVAYSDGLVQCIQFSKQHLMQNSNTVPVPLNNNSIPSLILCELFVSSGQNKNPIFNIFLNFCALTYGENSFQFEFFLFTEDLKVSLYGVRQTDRHYISVDKADEKEGLLANESKDLDPSRKEEAAELIYTESVDATIGKSYLAEFELIADYQVVEKDAKIRSQTYIERLINKEICLFSLEGSLNNSSSVIETSALRRNLLLNVGGMVYVLEILHPYFHIVQSKWGKGNNVIRKEEANKFQLQSLIQCSARGPDLYSIANNEEEGEDEDELIFPTLLLLKGDSIELVSARNGAVIQTVFLTHLLSSLATETKLKGSVSKDRQLSLQEKDLEGQVCLFHWCPYTTLLIIGYNTGLISVIDFHHPVQSYNQRKPDFNYFRSNEVHNAEITLIKTFPFTFYSQFIDDPMHPEKGKDITVLLVGDSNGMLSLWQLHPLRLYNKSPLLCKQNQHTGKLIYASLCSVPPGLVTNEREEKKSQQISFDLSASEAKDSNHKVLITTCSKGRVYAWRVEKDLTLHMISFFHSNRGNNTKVCCALALPKMMYRKLFIPKPTIITSSAASIDSKETAGKDLLVPVANLYYEIFCVLGYSDGMLEVWNISSDPRYCTNEPIFISQDLTNSLKSILQCLTDSSDLKTNHHNTNHYVPNNMTVEFTLVNHPQDFLWANPQESPYPNSAIESLLCGYEDGTVVTLELKINPFFTLDEPNSVGGNRIGVRRLNYYHTPFALIALHPLNKHNMTLKTLRQVNNDSYFPDTLSIWDYALVGEFDVLKVLPYLPISKALPWRWRSDWRSSNHNVDGNQEFALENIGHHNPPNAHENELQQQEEEYGRGEIDILEEYSHMSSHDQSMEENSLLSNLDNISTAESHNANDGSVASFYSKSTATASFHRDKKQYVGPMESMQRIINSDLYVAKKDKKLLEIFTQNANTTTGSIPAEMVIDIIVNWCNELQGLRANSIKNKISAINISTGTHEIKRKNLKELFRLLEIHSTDEMRFIEVAKIAAITLSAVKKGIETANQQQSRVQNNLPNANSSYKKLRKQVTKVSYNSMGERVVEKIVLSDENMGLVNGMVTTVKNGLAVFLETHKSSIQLQKLFPDHISRTKRLLTAIPVGLQSLINPIKLPLLKDKWCVNHLHYFDELRAISIARSLLDMRSSSQYEVVQSREAFKVGANQVTDMPLLLVKYFERLYGECHVNMNVSRFKIANYMEACLQYSYFSVLNILKSSLYLDKTMISFASSEVALWLVVEARNMLIGRGQVLNGYTVNSVDNPYSNTARSVCWQYVSKSHAVSVCDELLRARGQYGPHFYLAILDVINGIAMVANDSSNNKGDEGDSVRSSSIIDNMNSLDSDVIDLEKYLEVLFFEYIRQCERVRPLKKRVFGEFSLNLASAAKSREISQRESRQIMDDDLDIGFGPYHNFNLDKVQELLRVCMGCDSLRTGQINNKLMEEALRLVLHVNLRSEDKGREGDAYKFVIAAKRRTKLRSIAEDQLISYIDIIALLLAWEEHQQGNVGISLPALLSYLPSIERAIEGSLARDLVQYFSLDSSLENTEDPLWVMSNNSPIAYAETKDNNLHNNSSDRLPTQHLASSENKPAALLQAGAHSSKTTLSIAMDGQWHTTLPLPPSDGPGLLSVSSLPLQPSSIKLTTPFPAASLSKQTEHRREVESLTVPGVLETRRSLSTLAGDAVGRVAPKTKAPLYPTELGLGSRNEVNEKRESYSRVMSRIQIGERTGEMEWQGEGEGEGEVDPLPQPVLSLHSPPKEPDLGIREDRLLVGKRERERLFSDEQSFAPLEDSLGSVDSNYQQYELSLEAEGEELIVPTHSNNNLFSSRSVLFFTPSLSHSLTPFLDMRDGERVRREKRWGEGAGETERAGREAEEEVSRRLKEASRREEVFSLEYTQEREEFEARRREKERLRRELARELREKEREGMKKYHQALREREERQRQGKERLRRGEEEEGEERRRKEREIGEILERNRGRALSRLEEKSRGEKGQEERERQEREVKEMRREDKESMKREKGEREERRLKLEALKREEEESMERRLAELAAVHSNNNRGGRDRGDSAPPSDDEEEEAEGEESEEGDGEEGRGEEGRDSLQALPALRVEERGPGGFQRKREKTLLLLMQQEEKEEEEQKGEVEEEGGAEDGEGEEGEREDFSSAFLYGAEEGEDSSLSLMERRIRLLLRRIEGAYREQRGHPRREKGLFSLPLLFFSDISFSPFAAPLRGGEGAGEADAEREAERARGKEEEGEEEREEREDKEESSLLAMRRAPFSDLDLLIKKHRRREEEKRSLLFSTEVEEIRAEDWGTLVKREHADWPLFFSRQGERLEQIKQLAREGEGEDKEEGRSATSSLLPLPPASPSAPTLPTPSLMEKSSHSLSSLPPDLFFPFSLSSTADTVSQASLPTPLPLGTVLRKQQVGRGERRFYAIEREELRGAAGGEGEEEEGVLVVELRGERGGKVEASLLVKEFPNKARRVRSCTLEKGNSYGGRMEVEVGSEEMGRGEVPLLLLLSSLPDQAGGEVSLWAYLSRGEEREAEGGEQVERMGRIRLLVKKLSLLSDAPLGEMALHFPRLAREAEEKATVEERERGEVRRKRGEVLKEMRSKWERGGGEGEGQGESLLSFAPSLSISYPSLAEESEEKKTGEEGGGEDEEEMSGKEEEKVTNERDDSPPTSPLSPHHEGGIEVEGAELFSPSPSDQEREKAILSSFPYLHYPYLSSSTGHLPPLHPTSSSQGGLRPSDSQPLRPHSSNFDEGKLERWLDSKHKLKPPKLSRISHLVHLDPKPVQYKITGKKRGAGGGK